jgi:hypothetical protein
MEYSSQRVLHSRCGEDRPQKVMEIVHSELMLHILKGAKEEGHHQRHPASAETARESPYPAWEGRPHASHCKVLEQI